MDPGQTGIELRASERDASLAAARAKTGLDDFGDDPDAELPPTPASTEGMQSVRTAITLNRTGGVNSFTTPTHAWLHCEFKNYTDPVGKDEVNQTRIYLARTLGRFAILVARNLRSLVRMMAQDHWCAAS